jgi:hypothetical protein
MTPARAERAERLAPYFEIQLRLARRMAELTGERLGEVVRNHTNLHRRLGLGVPAFAAPGTAWAAYAADLEASSVLADQVALTQAAFRQATEETLPLPGQTGFGCFAHEAPNADGGIKIHFYNCDTDDEGGPLASAKQPRRRAELAAMVRHIVETHPEATHIKGGSWLYHLEAYRRLFPPAYVATSTPHPGPHLTGTSSWGQLIDSREAIRPALRDAVVANLAVLDPAAPWRVFPYQPLTPSASVEAFVAHFADD